MYSKGSISDFLLFLYWKYMNYTVLSSINLEVISFMDERMAEAVMKGSQSEIGTWSR